jgi:beta-lactamase class D
MRFGKLLPLLIIVFITAGAVVKAQDLSGFFKHTKGAFVLYDLKLDRYVRYNERRCHQRFSPKSTFKIPNSLIGLDTGIISDANYVIPWDRQRYPPQDNWNQEPFNHWAQDQTLRSAIRYSVLWYYRELAKRVGKAKMQKYVGAFGYGNKTIGDRVDNFWLDDSLKISADEQVNFLKAFYTEKLQISKRSTDIVKDILVLEETPAYKLSGKTGGGPIAEATYIGWFVGYLETKGNVYFFAFNMEGPDFASIREPRVLITKRILRSLGYLPSS